jgi:hypothetical protein
VLLDRPRPITWRAHTTRTLILADGSHTPLFDNMLKVASGELTQ